MPRLKLILNPASDRWHTKDRSKSLRELIEHQARESYELVWATTERPRHATALAKSAGDEGFDVVVVVGGDGTVHEVVNGLMQIPADRRPKLGIIPVGSGNDFAYNLGFSHDVEESVPCLFGNKTRIIDVGTITDHTGRMEYWNNTVGLGFSGAVNLASRQLKRLRGFLLYLVAVLQTILFKPQALAATMRIDDQPPLERGIAMLSICNGPREGGGFPVAPDAVMDDGLITYTIMRKVNRLQMLYFLPIVMSAAHMRYQKFFQGGTAKHLSVTTDKTMAIHTDGEVFGSWEAGICEVNVSIIPSALQVLIC